MEENHHASYTTEQDNLIKWSNGRIQYGSLDRRVKETTLTWKNLSVYVRPEKSTLRRKSSQKPSIQVLNNVSGAAQPGTLLAVLGASGAGKTSLLGALSKRSPEALVVEGDVLINGEIVDEKMAKSIGYVDQTDLFINSLTVKEHLTFMARLKMDKREPMMNVKQKVTEVLNELGLTHTQNTMIGTSSGERCISGGERKRLSFATEILADPSLLLCDEPTSGLDSYNAKRLIQFIREIVSTGRTIVITIHQPSSDIFELFDGILLLAEGRTAFLGKSRHAVSFFESLGYSCPTSFNPADFYIHTLAVHPGHELQSNDRIKRICDAYETSDYSSEFFNTIQYQTNLALASSDAMAVEKITVVTSEKRNKPGFGVQLYWLMWRAFVDSYRNPYVYQIILVQRMVLALMVGAIYFGTTTLDQTGIQNIEGAINFIIMQSTFSSLFGSLAMLDTEFPIFLREHKNDVYGWAPYYLSKITIMAFDVSIWSFAYVILVYWLVGFQNEFYPFIMTLITIIVCANVSSACGVMLCAFFDRLDTRVLYVLPFQQFLLWTSGFMMNIDTIPVWIRWTTFVSWLNYTNELVSIIQWIGICNIECDQPPGEQCIDSGEKVLEKYHYDSSKFGEDFLKMISLFLFFHFLGFFALRRRAKKA